MTRLNQAVKLSFTATMLASLTLAMAMATERQTMAQFAEPDAGVIITEPIPEQADLSVDADISATDDASSGIVSLLDFSPDKDGFQFSNGDAASKMKQRVQEIESRFSSSHTAYGSLLALLFGKETACQRGHAVDDDEHCYTTVQARRWISNQALTAVKDGVCDGMAVASQMLWVLKNELQSNPFGERSENLNSLLETIQNRGLDAYDLDLEDQSLQKFLLETYTSQTADEIYKQEEASRQKSPKEVLARIQSSIENYSPGNQSWKDLVTIGIHQKDKNGRFVEGHTLVPFSVNSNGSFTTVEVYDANYPGQVQNLVFDTSNNTWEYQPEGIGQSKASLYKGDRDSKNLGVITLGQRTIPYANEKGFDSCPFCADVASDVVVTRIGEGRISIFKDQYKEQGVGFVPNSDSKYVNTIRNAKIIKPTDDGAATYVLPGSLDAYAVSDPTSQGRSRFNLEKTGLSVQVESSNIIYFYNPDPDRLAFTEERDLNAVMSGDTLGTSYKIKTTATDGLSKFYILNKKSKRVYFGGVNWDASAGTAEQAAAKTVTLDIEVTRIVDGTESVIKMDDVVSRSDEFNYIDLNALSWDSSQPSKEAKIHTGRVSKCIAFPGVEENYPNGLSYETASARWKHCMKEVWKDTFGKNTSANYTARPHRGDRGDDRE